MPQAMYSGALCGSHPHRQRCSSGLNGTATAENGEGKHRNDGRARRPTKFREAHEAWVDSAGVWHLIRHGISIGPKSTWPARIVTSDATKETPDLPKSLAAEDRFPRTSAVKWLTRQPA